MHTKSLALFLGVGLGLLGLGACNASDIGGDGPDMSGGGENDGGASDGRARDRDAACAAVRAGATLVKKPVDIIFVVDNSGSMTQEIQAIEKNINQNFADIIGKSELDYRVILLSKHGTADPGQSICITKPLSGNPTCTPPPAKPVNAARFFHYSTEIASHDSLAKIIATYNVADPSGAEPKGWSAWLRDDALKVFIEITDDEATGTLAAGFETQLFQKVPRMFGDANKRNYVFHTIAGLKENNPATAPWQPADALQMTKCTNGGGAVAPGLEYQKLSKSTGGLRFPICEHASFDAVFKKVAEGVVEGSKVACEFKVPDPPPGQQVDLSSVLVEYTPGAGGPAQEFKKVAGAAQCAPSTFYLDSGRIVLCPAACAVVQADAMAKLQVLFDCLLMIN